MSSYQQSTHQQPVWLGHWSSDLHADAKVIATIGHSYGLVEIHQTFISFWNPVFPGRPRAGFGISTGMSALP